MNIGLVVYSWTGHTLAVATEARDHLAAAGHKVTLERLETVGPVRPGDTNVQLRAMPGIDGYDALVFGSPVQGGMVSSPMATYLDQIASLQDKKVACLVTHFFPARWGANQALDQFKAICRAKGATVCALVEMGWPRFGRKDKMDHVAEQLRSSIG
jgi:multimeric flavodoxin WrbA